MSSHQTHYRWITGSDIPDEGLSSLSAVQVGTSGGRKVIHVNQPSSEYDGPGEFCADTLAEMASGTKKNVAEATWEEEDEDGNTLTRRGKMDEVPDGVTATQTDLHPHEFAGIEDW